MGTGAGCPCGTGRETDGAIAAAREPTSQWTSQARSDVSSRRARAAALPARLLERLVISGDHLVTVELGKTINGVDFGATRRGAISGRVFYDAVGDGVERDTDAGVPNLLVYVDLNADGVYQPGEPTQTTDPNGRYEIGNLF